MSKNKFRLTKKKIQSNEYTRKVMLKDGLIQVQFYSEGRVCQFDDVIRNYNNQVQYKRFDTFRNHVRKIDIWNSSSKLIQVTNVI